MQPNYKSIYVLAVAKSRAMMEKRFQKDARGKTAP
jgi:hypothetical protein